MASLVIAPFTVITAWFYYFGWVRANSIFSYFGIDQPMLGFTSQDYLLRSVGIAFKPLLIFLLAMAACFILGKAFTEVNMRHRSAGLALRYALCATGAALIGLGVAGAFELWPRPEPIGAALSLAIGALLVEVTRTSTGTAGRRDLPQRALVWLTVIVGAFWATALHAQETGTNWAEGWASNAYVRPQVIVHSATDIGIAGNGINREVTNSKKAYRYSGLRLLIYSNKKWFLLSGRSGNGNPSAVVILPDDDKVRVEILKPADRQ